MKKLYAIAMFASLGMSSAIADTSVPDVKGNMQVTANVDGGCEISGTDFVFGAAKFDDVNKSTNGTIDIQCSKGVTLILERTSLNSTGTNHGQMRLIDDKVVGYVRYEMFTTGVQDNADVTITQRPLYEYLGTFDKTTNKDYRLGIRMETGNLVKLPIRAAYTSSSFTTPGDYADQATYKITF